MDQVEFPPRIRNVLAAAGLKTVGEVREISDDTLPSHPPVDHYRYRVPTSAGPAISDEPRDQPHDDISLLRDSRHLLVGPSQHGNSPSNVYPQGFAPWRDLPASFSRDINRERVCAGSHAAKKMLA
jgi:hypothetical protein